MNTQLTDALKQLNLQPGQVHRVAVNGFQVEIRVLPSEEASDFPDGMMIDLWLEPPEPPGMRRLHPQPGSLDLPDPPMVPADEETAV